MNEQVRRVWEIVEKILYINIATSSHDNKQWNTPVYAVHNGELVFFWRSWKESQHSQNIRENSNVFITIYDTTTELGQNHQRCVYVEAKAYEITDKEEIDAVLPLFLNNNETANNFMGDNVKRLYKAVPEKVWLNDKGQSQLTTETVKMRVAVPLDDLRKLPHQ